MLNNKKSIIIISIVLSIIMIIFMIFYKVFGIQNYYKTDFSTGLVTATNLNIRSGPGTNYEIVATVKKNEYIRVFAGIGDWYIVQVNGDYIGAASKKYIKPIYPNSSKNSGGSSSSNTSVSDLTADEKEVFNLINVQRKNNGLSELKIDSEVQRVARIKAQDMNDNNYFAHESPTYGSPFQMLNSFKVSYRTAGENIAGNSSNSGAVTAWMNSSGHRANILNSSYNYTGIGVVSNSKYGKLYVQMFIGK
ncbi:MAG: SH3 domain-containing protein [Clostridia bacterium]|nr:SH3 domain-containing protein [Clostridia bacterium]